MSLDSAFNRAHLAIRETATLIDAMARKRPYGSD
jgi:hypothetical protein